MRSTYCSILSILKERQTMNDIFLTKVDTFMRRSKSLNRVVDFMLDQIAPKIVSDGLCNCGLVGSGSCKKNCHIGGSTPLCNPNWEYDNCSITYYSCGTHVSCSQWSTCGGSNPCAGSSCPTSTC
jgi:hypothetical protein